VRWSDCVNMFPDLVILASAFPSADRWLRWQLM